MRWMPGLSIRARITLGSLAIAAVLFSLAALFFRLEVQSILTETTTTLLRNDAETVETALSQDPTGKIASPGEGQLVAVIDPAGRIEISSLPKSLATRTSLLATLGAKPHQVTAGQSTYLVAAQTVRTTTGKWIIVSARNQEARSLLLDELTRALMIGAVVLIVGFGVASWLLTGAALRPVNRLRAEAESLSTVESSAELLVPAGKDEISLLAITLNAFIARLRRGVDREKQVVSDASHELRTPLAVLKTQLELAHLNSGNAPALEKDIDDASVTVDRLSRLATNLLELSKVESQEIPPKIDWAGLTSEITASIDRARAAQDVSALEVAYVINGDDPVGHYAISRTNVGQLFDNLIFNAVAAINGKGTVTVTLDRDVGGAVVTVIDTGPGMPEEFIPLAFNRFSRPDQSRASGAGGAGLGLAIVSAIVERAHGTITLRNTGGGLAVEVRLPRQMHVNL